MRKQDRKIMITVQEKSDYLNSIGHSKNLIHTNDKMSTFSQN